MKIGINFIISESTDCQDSDWSALFVQTMPRTADRNNGTFKNMKRILTL
jgi:hypothetical protein